jgi:ribonuclease HII
LFVAATYRRPCGVDEAGRGPLAGPVYAAAVVLNPRRPIVGLADSKRLSAVVRQKLAQAIRERALGFAIASASVEEIDEINILRASLLAMKRAVEALTVSPDGALIDGNQLPDLRLPSQAIVRGDATVAAISAASILAKTERDAYMCAMHESYPLYGFDRHMGYGTALHLQTLRRYGACPMHRRSFAPVREVLAMALP